jgi:hypothetical protein
MNGQKICTYCDFLYQRDGGRVVEDVKSPASMTSTYRLKKKLMLVSTHSFDPRLHLSRAAAALALDLTFQSVVLGRPV